jgi:RNA polymerase sigma-70 factor (ECF subfamily)
VSHPHQAGFEALYSAHRQTLHAYFVGKTGDSDLALDLVQEVFVRLWRNLPAVVSLAEARQRAWLFSVARNLVIDEYRGREARRASGAQLARQAALAESAAPATDALAMQRLRVQAVDAAIRRLPEDFRTILVLSVLGERSSAEIGEVLGRPAGTVRYQLLQARRQLAADLRLREQNVDD